MRLAINVLAAALAVACLELTACGGNGPADLQSSPNGNTSGASAVKTASQGTATASPNGTTIPSATQIIDGSGDIWTVSGGVVYENGVPASFTANVTLLLYDNNTLYQENSGGGWWSWNGSSWIASSDPRLIASSTNGTAIPSATQIIDTGGNIWTVSGGVVYENGALAPYTANVTLLLYDNNTLYQENSGGGWWSWNGSSWIASSDPLSGSATLTIGGSPPTADVAGQPYGFVPTTTNPGGGALSFSITNMPVWASFSTVTGALTGTPSSAQAGVYSNILIDVSSGGASASLAAFAITVTTAGTAPTGSASLSWTAPTQNIDGTPLTDLAGYTIYYGISPGALTQTIQLANPSATSYVVSNLGTGTYYFAVAGYTTAGIQGAQSSEASKTIP